MSLSKSERLKLFFQALEKAEPVSTPLEVIELVNNTLDNIEDLYSGIIKDPNPLPMKSERMYGIQSDYLKVLPDGSGLRGKTFGHIIKAFNDGSFEIINKNTNEIELKKSGKGPNDERQ